MSNYINLARRGVIKTHVSDAGVVAMLTLYIRNSFCIYRKERVAITASPKHFCGVQPVFACTLRHALVTGLFHYFLGTRPLTVAC